VAGPGRPTTTNQRNKSAAEKVVKASKKRRP